MAIIRCPHCGGECDLATGIRQCANCAGDLPLPNAAFEPGKPTNGLSQPASTAVQPPPASIVRCPHCGRANEPDKGVEYCVQCGRDLTPGTGPDEASIRAAALSDATRTASQTLLVGGALMLLFAALSFASITPDSPRPEETNEWRSPYGATPQQRWEASQEQRNCDLILAPIATGFGLAVAVVGLWARLQPFEASFAGVAVIGLATVATATLIFANIENVCFGSTKVLVLVYFLSLVLRACLRINEIRQPL